MCYCAISHLSSIGLFPCFLSTSVYQSFLCIVPYFLCHWTVFFPQLLHTCIYILDNLPVTSLICLYSCIIVFIFCLPFCVSLIFYTSFHFPVCVHISFSIYPPRVKDFDTLWAQHLQKWPPLFLGCRGREGGVCHVDWSGCLSIALHMTTISSGLSWVGFFSVFALHLS